MFLSLGPSRVQSPLSCHAYRNTGPRPIHRAQHPQSQVRAACMRCVMEAHYCSRVWAAHARALAVNSHAGSAFVATSSWATRMTSCTSPRGQYLASQVYRVFAVQTSDQSLFSVSEKRNSPGLAPIDRCHCYSAPPSNTPCHPTPEALAFLHSGAAAFKKPSTAAAAKGVQ